MGVIVEPNRNEPIGEILEDCALYCESERRMKSASETDLLSQDQVMSSLGISDDDLDDVYVDID